MEMKKMNAEEMVISGKRLKFAKIEDNFVIWELATKEEVAKNVNLDRACSACGRFANVVVLHTIKLCSSCHQVRK